MMIRNNDETRLAFHISNIYFKIHVLIRRWDLFVCVSVSCLSSHLHEVIVGAPEDVHLHLQPVDVLTLDPHVHRANVHLGAGHLRLELFVQHLVVHGGEVERKVCEVLLNTSSLNLSSSSR